MGRVEFLTRVFRTLHSRASQGVAAHHCSEEDNKHTLHSAEAAANKHAANAPLEPFVVRKLEMIMCQDEGNKWLAATRAALVNPDDDVHSKWRACQKSCTSEMESDIGGGLKLAGKLELSSFAFCIHIHERHEPVHLQRHEMAGGLWSGRQWAARAARLDTLAVCCCCRVPARRLHMTAVLRASSRR